MTKHDDSRSVRPTQGSNNMSKSPRGRTRKTLLFTLLGAALFALWYDYQVARPAVEQAYQQIAAANQQVNCLAKYRRMTNVDVQEALGRMPNETFNKEEYTVEVYRWNAGLPLDLRGLFVADAPSIRLKTHDYYAVYRREGTGLAFLSHFKFQLETNDLSVARSSVAVSDTMLPNMEVMNAVYAGHYGDLYNFVDVPAPDCLDANSIADLATTEQETSSDK